MSIETNAPTEIEPKTARKRASRKVTNDFLDKTRAEMTAKAKELDVEMKEAQKKLDHSEKFRNERAADLMRITSERDRVVAGLVAIDKAVSMKDKAS